MSREMQPPSVFDSLPEDLLVDIVTRLPLKESARTSIVAKRWTSIWRQTKNIELNQNFFVKKDQDALDLLRNEGPGPLMSFVTFARDFLNAHQGRDISSFKLVLGEFAVLIAPLLYHYVKFAVSRNVKHLIIDLTQPVWGRQPQPFSPGPVMALPDLFYQRQCERYETLFLSGVKINLSNCFNFGVLKSVSIGWIELDDDDIKRLVAQSPCLMELRLVRCWGFDVDIESKSLEKLVVDKCNLEQDAVSVIAPNLKVFIYSGLFGDINFHGTVAELEEVYIDFDMEEDFDHFWTLMYDQFMQFENVRVLQVCSFVLQILPFIFTDLLHVNPKHLILKTASFHPNDFHGIEYILYSCNSVELLTIHITDRSLLSGYEFPMAFDPDLFWEIGNREPAKCLEKSLKVVEVKGFSGTGHQVQFLQQIMLLGKLLENVILYKDENAQLDEVDAGYQLLLQSHKLATNLQITYM